MDNKIGFVVWGIRNGFKNNWLAANVDASVYQLLTDDMRQICNSTVDKFYSIEKIDNHTVLSVFNPNTKDHVQRKAYIALSIVIPNGYAIVGDAIECLNLMLQTYEVKQGNAMVNMVNAEDVKAHLAQLQLKPEANFIPSAGNGIGVFHCNDFDQIQMHFSGPTIFGFKKVFFISGQNVALERIPGIQNVQSFAKPLFLTLSEFDPNKHNATINGQAITMSKTQVKQGDVIRVVDFTTKQSKEFQITGNDVHISLRDLFPPIIKQATPPSDIYYQSRFNGNKNKIIALLSTAVLVIGCIVYNLLSSDALPDLGGGAEGGPEASTQEFSATYDFQELELLNFPEWADESTQFYLYKLNGTTLLDSVTKAAPQVKVALKRLTDTLIEIRFTLNDESKTKRVKVTFKLPSAHKIKSLQSLSEIADIYGIDEDSLAKWNYISNKGIITEGKELLLKPKRLVKVVTDETTATNDGTPNPPEVAKVKLPSDTEPANGGNSSSGANTPAKVAINQNTAEFYKKEINDFIHELEIRPKQTKADTLAIKGYKNELIKCRNELLKLKNMYENKVK